MKFKSQSLVKVALLASIVIGSTSIWFGKKNTKELPAVKAQIAALEKATAESTASLDELKGMQTTKEEAFRPLDAAVSSFLLEVMNARTAYGVTIAQTTTGKPIAGERAAIVDLGDTLPGTNVKSVKVDLQGNYTDYERFEQFLGFLRKAGLVSIVSLSVKANTYAISVRLYGKAS